MQWTPTCLDRFAPHNSEDAIFDSVLWAARELGYEQCSINIFVHRPLGQNKVYKRNNYSLAWNCFYRDNHCSKNDPMLQKSLLAQLPMLWTDELFEANPELWGDYQRHGLRYGLTQAVHSGRGASCLLSLARSQDVISTQEFNDKTGDVLWLTNLVHSALVPRIEAQVQQQIVDSVAQASLSSRELEVLKWTAMGLTSVDVGKVLKLSERTVNFHIARCIEKLGVCNKLSAVVKTVLSGLI
ncbi:autoinducer binding domain-containing protein [Pseudomonas sp. TE3610]